MKEGGRTSREGTLGDRYCIKGEAGAHTKLNYFSSPSLNCFTA